MREETWAKRGSASVDHTRGAHADLMDLERMAAGQEILHIVFAGCRLSLNDSGQGDRAMPAELSRLVPSFVMTYFSDADDAA